MPEKEQTLEKFLKQKSGFVRNDDIDSVDYASFDKTVEVVELKDALRAVELAREQQAKQIFEKLEGFRIIARTKESERAGIQNFDYVIPIRNFLEIKSKFVQSHEEKRLNKAKNPDAYDKYLSKIVKTEKFVKEAEKK